MQEHKKSNDWLGIILASFAVVLLAFALGFQGYRSSSTNIEPTDVEPSIENDESEVLLQDSVTETSVEATETLTPTETEVFEVVEEEQTPPIDENIIYIPEILRIPSISLEANILPVVLVEVYVNEVLYLQWQTLDNDVAWHSTSATLGIVGNTVFSGHHNTGDMVFEDLAILEIGTIIQIESNGVVFEYEITESMILPEMYETVAVRLENAKWMEETDDERITLITCWPAESNTHRVIVIAMPIN